MQIKEKLLIRVQDEYLKFMEHLKMQDKEIILKKAYEQVYKEEILYVLAGDTISDEERKVLLKEDEPLEVCYHAWQKSEDDVAATLAASIRREVETLQNIQEKRNPSKMKNIHERGGKSR